MQRIAIYGPNIQFPHGVTFEVHAAECSDPKHGPCAQDPYPLVFDAYSMTEICDEVYVPDDFECESGEYMDDFYFAPCVHLPI